MGWTQRAANDVAERVVLHEDKGEMAFELRWDDQGVIAGVMTDDADVSALADEFAEAVEADLKLRVHRFGEHLPWSETGW